MVTNPVTVGLDSEPTGEYDVGFFLSLPPEPARRPTIEVLADARVGLGLFVEEAREALRQDDLTTDQRLHIATIVSYVEGLADRFDRISMPGYVQNSLPPACNP